MTRQQTPKFLRKLYWLLDNPQYQDIISWDLNGANIIIKDQKMLHSSIIPQYFSLKKFSSFVRQLHLYGFHKIKSKNFDLIFSNPLFTRDQRELSKSIVRKRKAKVNQNIAMPSINNLSPASLSYNFSTPQIELKFENNVIYDCKDIKQFSCPQSIPFLTQNKEEVDNYRYSDIFDEII